MGIKKYLKHTEELKLIQARIDAALYEKLRLRLKKDNVKIRDFIEAAAKSYLNEK